MKNKPTSIIIYINVVYATQTIPNKTYGKVQCELYLLYFPFTLLL